MPVGGAVQEWLPESVRIVIKAIRNLNVNHSTFFHYGQKHDQYTPVVLTVELDLLTLGTSEVLALKCSIVTGIIVSKGGTERTTRCPTSPLVRNDPASHGVG